jgi:uncharacterized protein with PIN domain
VAQAFLRFYGELSLFLSVERRQVTFAHEFRERVAVKDVVESYGVPHTEVDLLLVSGVSQPFSHILEDGARVSCYPRFHALDVGAVSLVRPPGPTRPTFLLDSHLGSLAAYLRMAGFDTSYGNDAHDEDLAATSAAEDRVLLTRDVGLLKRGAVRLGCYIHETSPRLQLLEVFRRFELAGHVRPFTRCLRCNTVIEPCAKEAVLDRVPPRSRDHYDEFWRCSGCGRVYWKGSHYARMAQFIQRVVEEAVRRR